MSKGNQQIVDQGAARVVTFSPDGQLLVAGGPFWSGLRIYDTSTTGLLKTLDWNEKTLFSIAFSPDGELIALGNDEYSFDEQQGLARLADLSACCSKDGRLTMRAPDWWESARFQAVFVAWS